MASSSWKGLLWRNANPLLLTHTAQYRRHIWACSLPVRYVPKTGHGQASDAQALGPWQLHDVNPRRLAETGGDLSKSGHGSMQRRTPNYIKSKSHGMGEEELQEVEGRATVFSPDRAAENSHEMQAVAAKDYCVSLLALGPQPESKLRTKMSNKKFSQQVMDSTIEQLQSCGLQSDLDYSEVFARSRWNGNAWGPKRIKMELLRRGISKENVEAGLQHVFQNDEDGEGEEGKWGMNPKAVEQLLAQARRRWSQGSKVEVGVRKRRMAGWLQRRGFSWDVISDLLRIFERESAEEPG